MGGVRVSGLYRYPLKSARGHPVDELPVERQGPAGDRRWMVVDGRGRAVTARQEPRLVLVGARVEPGGLHLTAPGAPPLAVREPVPGPTVRVHLWGDEVDTAPAGPAADRWLSDLLGRPLRLVFQHDPASRPTDPEHSAATDRVSLADGFPLLLTSEESLDALNGWIVEDSGGAAGPVDVRRFRPNVVVRGAGPWAEDGWTRLRVGAVTFRAPKPCGRCVLTTVDPDTGVRGREPLATLSRHRRRGRTVLFGVNLLPDDLPPHAVLRIGDEIEECP